jgi:hypothetical protein
MMNTEQIYIAISVVTLLILIVLLTRRLLRGEKSGLTPKASLAFGFIVAGFLFGEDRLVSYGLMGIGVGIAILDILDQRKQRDPDDPSRTNP